MIHRDVKHIANETPFGIPLTTRRGAGGLLCLCWWQAPTNLNIHLAVGSKDNDAAALVTEPLARISRNSFLPDIPILAKEIPSIQNGQLAPDFKNITWTLKPGVVWSDGVPFTARDVVFTWQWIMQPEHGCTNTEAYSDIANIEELAPTVVKITFKAPTAGQFLPFVGDGGGILPYHILHHCSTARIRAFNQSPIGTGPYTVAHFQPGNTILYTANKTFREPNAPYFSTVEIKSVSGAEEAAKTLLTNQADYAWNLQIVPSLLEQLQDAGKTVVASAGPAVEQLVLNMADPRMKIDGEFSSPKSRNPFFADPLVCQALTYAVDREAITRRFYGISGAAGNTLIPLIRENSGKPWSYNPNKAAALLNQAGWIMSDDGTREKNGVKMDITFRSSASFVRSSTAQMIKKNCERLGIHLELDLVDASVFFGGPEHPDAVNRFTADVQLVSTGSVKPDAQYFFESFTTRQISQQSNNWGAVTSIVGRSRSMMRFKHN